MQGFRVGGLCSVLGCVAAMANVATPAAAAFARHYNLMISTSPTHNVTLNNGVFAPTGAQPMLNENDLVNALANGAVEVTTGNGYGGRGPGDLLVEAGFTWTGTNALTLDAYHSVVVDQPIVNSGTGALTIVDNDKGMGGYLSFGSSGSITILNLSNVLDIDGTQYTLVGDISTLAYDIETVNRKGSYALANSYDASADGTYHNPPIGAFWGVLEGLGNTISNLSVSTTYSAGLFSGIGGPSEYGTILDLGLINANVSGGNDRTGGNAAGALAALATGMIRNCYSTGAVEARGRGASAGGLVGGASNDSFENAYSMAVVTEKGTGGYAGGLSGTSSGGNVIESSFATGAVSGGVDSFVGGLIGRNFTTPIRKSFATGSVSVGKWDGVTPSPTAAGGLIGFNFSSSIANSYAEGNVSGGSHAVVGGLVGLGSESTLQKLYATGTPTVGKRGLAGGFIGKDRRGYAKDGYWDTTTSGTMNGTGTGQKKGVTGLTTTQLQSGLPKGLDSNVWGEDSAINNGLPYLINNPPPQ
jgi:hypothetical protein